MDSSQDPPDDAGMSGPRCDGHGRLARRIFNVDVDDPLLRRLPGEGEQRLHDRHVASPARQVQGSVAAVLRAHLGSCSAVSGRFTAFISRRPRSGKWDTFLHIKHRQTAHCEISRHCTLYFVPSVVSSFLLEVPTDNQLGCTLSAQHTVEHDKNNLQNIMT